MQRGHSGRRSGPFTPERICHTKSHKSRIALLPGGSDAGIDVGATAADLDDHRPCGGLSRRRRDRLAHRRRPDPPLHLSRGRARARSSSPARSCGSGSSPATGSARSPGTPIAISSFITRSPASARCAIRSTRGCSTTRSSISSTTPPTGCCLSTRPFCHWSSASPRASRRDCRIVPMTDADAPQPDRRAGLLRRAAGGRERAISTGPNSTSAPPPRSATPRAPPATRRVRSTAIARRYCTPSAFRCPTRSRSRPMTWSARWCRCFTPAAGASPMPRR